VIRLEQPRRCRPIRSKILIATCALSMVAGVCAPRFDSPSDRLLHQDWLDTQLNQVAFALPDRPIISSGSDGEFGTEDDVVNQLKIGDLDLVLRVGISESIGPLPAPALSMDPPFLAAAATIGTGTEVDFIVAAVDGHAASPLDNPILSASIEGNPMLVLAFADLDADGLIGPTLRDGDPFDTEVESAELEPIGMQISTVVDGYATGRLRLLAGGPAGNPTRVLLTAAIFAGPRDPEILGGVIPIGPALSTALPFLPSTTVDDIIDTGRPAGPEPVTQDRPLGIKITRAFDPDPSDPISGELFSLRVDGSEISVDGASSLAGPVSKVGLALSARLLTYENLVRRVVRSGVDDQGRPHPYEIAERITVSDDGPTSEVDIRVVPLDRLGNITDLFGPEIVTLSTGGIVEILFPDTDADPYRETVVLSGAQGTILRLGDPGGVFDDPLSDTLIIDSQIGGAIIDLVLPDPDVDDSGVVDENDLAQVKAARGLQHGELFYQPRLDVNGDGRIDKKDELLVSSLQGLVVTTP
jgi:hypothetical protein